MSSNHEAKILENLSKLMYNEMFHDLTIGLSEGHGSVRANKAILCSNSTFVASFFNNNDQDPNVDIKIPTTLESMKLVLKYWYTGKMEYDSLSLKDTLDLLKLLEFLEEEELFSDIESFLVRGRKLFTGEGSLINKYFRGIQVQENYQCNVEQHL